MKPYITDAYPAGQVCKTKSLIIGNHGSTYFSYILFLLCQDYGIKALLYDWATGA